MRAERWARNIQHILREEAGLGEHADVMKGSRAIEALTRQMAEQAWARYEEMEAAGGWRAGADLMKAWTLEGQRAHLARPWYVSTDMARGEKPWAEDAEARFFPLDHAALEPSRQPIRARRGPRSCATARRSEARTRTRALGRGWRRTWADRTRRCMR